MKKIYLAAILISFAGYVTAQRTMSSTTSGNVTKTSTSTSGSISSNKPTYTAPTNNSSSGTYSSGNTSSTYSGNTSTYSSGNNSSNYSNNNSSTYSSGNNSSNYSNNNTSTYSSGSTTTKNSGYNSSSNYSGSGYGSTTPIVTTPSSNTNSSMNTNISGGRTNTSATTGSGSSSGSSGSSGSFYRGNTYSSGSMSSNYPTVYYETYTYTTYSNTNNVNNVVRSVPPCPTCYPNLYAPATPGYRVHFSGALMSDRSKSYSDGWTREIFQQDDAGDMLGVGKYPYMQDALQRSSGTTLDGIAIDKNVRLVIYSQPNFQGDILLDVQGPAIINNGYRFNSWNQITGEPNDKTYYNSLQNEFPQNLRGWSQTNMNDWPNGSMMIMEVQ